MIPFVYFIIFYISVFCAVSITSPGLSFTFLLDCLPYSACLPCPTLIPYLFLPYPIVSCPSLPMHLYPLYPTLPVHACPTLPYLTLLWLPRSALHCLHCSALAYLAWRPCPPCVIMAVAKTCFCHYRFRRPAYNSPGKEHH